MCDLTTIGIITQQIKNKHLKSTTTLTLTVIWCMIVKQCCYKLALWAFPSNMKVCMECQSCTWRHIWDAFGKPAGANSHWSIWQCLSCSIACHFPMLQNSLIICPLMWSFRIGLCTNCGCSHVGRNVSELWGEKHSYYSYIIGIVCVLAVRSRKAS